MATDSPTRDGLVTITCLDSLADEDATAMFVRPDRTADALVAMARKVLGGPVDLVAVRKPHGNGHVVQSGLCGLCGQNPVAQWWEIPQRNGTHGHVGICVDCVCQLNGSDEEEAA